jgi:ATP-dependent DNA helicase RecG
VLFTKDNGKITNSDYQNLNNVSRETASRDLKELTEIKIFKSSGHKGAGAFYTIE